MNTFAWLSKTTIVSMFFLIVLVCTVGSLPFLELRVITNFVAHEAVITSRWIDFHVVVHINWEVKWTSFHPFNLKARLLKHPIKNWHCYPAIPVGIRMIRKARKVAEEQISPSLKSSENTLTHQWKTFSHPSNYPDFFFFNFLHFPLGWNQELLRNI